LILLPNAKAYLSQMKNYDIFIFGTGNAGKLVAKRCAAAGFKTAIIDNREYGGTCSQRGCK
ncbi:MAG: NAD(P)/FAD-dependent oxidoreductase, partial [Nonlabens sp.]|nr:NAD(P)/FAD-dependent oxidoreductase [Nonlabens sp.]